MLIRDTRLVRLEPGGSEDAEVLDVRLVDGSVTEVGQGLAARAEEEFDAQGRWLMPGLWDAHVHLGQWVRGAARLDLSEVSSVDEATATVVARAASQPGEAVVGFGHRPATWGEQPATAALDALGLDVPVVLIAGDAHHGWLNSAGLAWLGLPMTAGVVSESEWFAAYARLGELLDDEASPRAYARAMARARAVGIVGMVDFEFDNAPRTWAARWQAGADLVRVRMATYADGLDGVLAAGLRSGDPLAGDARLTMGPLKVISDGSLNTRTAWCCEPYAGTGVHGAANQSAAELEDLLRRAHGHGLEAAVHAIGDRALTEALDVFAATGARGTIEHVQLSTRADLARMAALGVAASVQPAHLLDDREVSEQWWPGRGDRCFALRSMTEHGVALRLGSDAPVAQLDPWLAMAAAVHRGRTDSEAWHPEQSLTAREALAASTDGWGTVAAGHPADLVLLDENPVADDVSAPSAQVAARLARCGELVSSVWVAGVRTDC